jgi:hypothetical protein
LSGFIALTSIVQRTLRKFLGRSNLALLDKFKDSETRLCVCPENTGIWLGKIESAIHPGSTFSGIPYHGGE